VGQQRHLVHIEIEFQRAFDRDGEAVEREEHDGVVAGEFKALALDVHDRNGEEIGVEPVRALFKDLALHALLVLADQKSFVAGRRGIAAAGKDVRAAERGHHAHMAGRDLDVVKDFDFVGERVDAVLAGAEHVAHDALVRVVGRDDRSAGQVLAELAHQHAEFAGRDVGALGDDPAPRVGVAEETRIRQDLELDAFVRGRVGDDAVGRQVLAGLLDQDRDLAVVRLDAPAVPDPERDGQQQRQDQERQRRRRRDGW